MTAAAAKQEPFAAIAEFGSASELYHAAEKVRDKGFRFWDVHSPFPIHGMNKAMGLGKSYLGYIIFCGGFSPVSTAGFLEFIPSSFLSPLLVYGKTGYVFIVPPLFLLLFVLSALFSRVSVLFAVF